MKVLKRDSFGIKDFERLKHKILWQQALKGFIERNSVAEEISETPAEKRAAETPQWAFRGGSGVRPRKASLFPLRSE
ncbi:hypothetical protein [Sediminibacillus dalangtanensis]|uniref:hypothetical protein n=1 Tax=Sediminibacillus dalangtanensis TaxID=2729421 RepID=UPI001FD7A5F2|nr:hypothetical protein [Sediminibacillus dalangtanensis]